MVDDRFYGLPFIQSVVDQAQYWLWRAIGGGLMFLGHLVFALNVWMMVWGKLPEPAPDIRAAGVPA